MYNIFTHVLKLQGNLWANVVYGFPLINFHIYLTLNVNKGFIFIVSKYLVSLLKTIKKAVNWLKKYTLYIKLKPQYYQGTVTIGCSYL